MSSSGPQDVGHLTSADLWRLAESFSVQLRKMSALGIRGRRQVGQRQSGSDFDGYHPYRLGDDVRHLDWSVYARSRRLAVRRFQDDKTGVLVLLLDASGSMMVGDPSKWMFSRALGTVVALAALHELHQVVLGVINKGEVRVLPALHGMDSANAVTDFLGTIKPAGRTELAPAIDQATHGLQQADLLVVSDFLDPSGGDAGLIAAGRQNGGLHFARVTAPGEFVLPSAEESVFDPESGEARSRSLRGVSAAEFQTAVKTHTAMLETRAVALGANLMEFSSAEGLPGALERLFSHFRSGPVRRA